jgi:uncharacterized membrane protein (DUF485 family)
MVRHNGRNGHVSRKIERVWQHKKRTLTWLTVGFFIYFFSLPLLTSYAPRLMNYPLIGSVSVAWFFALSQFAMAGVICLVYALTAHKWDRALQQATDNTEQRDNIEQHDNPVQHDNTRQYDNTEQYESIGQHKENKETEHRSDRNTDNKNGDSTDDEGWR